MKIEILNKEIELRQTCRTDIIYENIKDNSFTGRTQSEWIVYFYSCILACSNLTELSIEEFFDWLDENRTKLIEFVEWYTKTYQVLADATKKSNKQPKTRKP